MPEITERQFREKIHQQSELIARLNRNITRLQRRIRTLQLSEKSNGISDVVLLRNDVNKSMLNNDKLFPPIYMITPTYARWTQKADLMRLSQTLMHVPNLHWIVVEDAEERTKLVTNFLLRRKNVLRSTHLNVRTEKSRR